MSATATKSFLKLAFSLFFVAVMLMLLYALGRWVSRGGTEQRPTLTGTFSRRICEDAYKTENTTYANENPTFIDLRLSDGCFNGFVSIPKKWHTWQGQFLGDDPTDWIAYWPAGDASPLGPFSAQQMNDATVSVTLPEMKTRFEGKGTIRYYRVTGDGTTTNPEPSALPTREGPAAQRAATATAEPTQLPPPRILHPVVPSSGASPYYSMEIDECVRNGQIVECWGYVTNKTDAITPVHLETSTNVDDEGNESRSWAFDLGFTGSDDRLMPDVRTKFFVKIVDPHLSAKSMTLNIGVRFNGPESQLIFRDIPIEQ